MMYVPTTLEPVLLQFTVRISDTVALSMIHHQMQQYYMYVASITDPDLYRMIAFMENNNSNEG